MVNLGNQPRALIILSDGIYPDSLVCSGAMSSDIHPSPCPYSEKGHMPSVQPLNANDPTYSIDKGRHGDLCPPCAKQQLAYLGHWQGHGGQQFPNELLPLRLFKCRQWFWLVVPDLYDDEPTKLRKSK
jgi:hypothetical protein